ncbi:MAG TPA: acyl-CoA dehydrogenase family protein, partial [Nocardioides sp.]
MNPHGVQTETQAAVDAVMTEVVEREVVTWSELASAGVLGLAVPEFLGGEGLGLAELSVVLERLGARAADVPAWETLVGGTLTIAAAATPDQQKRLLDGVESGSTVITVAVREPGHAFPTEPQTVVAGSGEALVLNGTKLGVTHVDDAAHVLVLASYDGKPAVAVVDPRRHGVTLRASRSSTGAVQHSIDFNDVSVELVGEDHVLAARLLVEHSQAGIALLGAGLVAGARDLTAGYLKERTQFGRKLAEFQAVSQQIAEVYITSRLLTLAARNAAW